MSKKLGVNSNIQDIADNISNALSKKRNYVNTNISNQDGDLLELTSESEIEEIFSDDENLYTENIDNENPDYQEEEQFQSTTHYSTSIEDMVREILKPNIRKWLDLNLDRIVREELKKQLKIRE